MKNPEKLFQGDTCKIRVAAGDYASADGWTTILLIANTGAAHEVAGTEEDGVWEFVVPTATTAAMAVGSWAWRVQAALDGEKYTLAQGHLDVVLGLSAAGDFRSWPQRALEAVQAVLEGKATSGQQRFTVMGREIWSYPLSELMSLRDKLRAELQTERSAADAASGRVRRGRVLVRFPR